MSVRQFAQGAWNALQAVVVAVTGLFHRRILGQSFATRKPLNLAGQGSTGGKTEKESAGNPRKIYTSQKAKSRAKHGGEKMEFFESDVPAGDGLCSDNECPCDDTVIRRGTGYLFIDEDIVKFRRKYPSMQAAIHAKELAAQARGGSAWCTALHGERSYRSHLSVRSGISSPKT
jgi:hypothetical protein